jgi:hypothetical protein
VSDATPETPGTNGGTVELTPKEKRALREQARREVLTAEKERIAKERAAKDAPATPSGAPTPAPAPDIPADAVLVSWAAAFLRGVLYPAISLGVRVLRVGRLDLALYTDARAKDEAAAWVPLLREYDTLRGVVKWMTVPARVVATVRDLFRSRESKPDAAPEVRP